MKRAIFKGIEISRLPIPIEIFTIIITRPLHFSPILVSRTPGSALLQYNDNSWGKPKLLKNFRKVAWICQGKSEIMRFCHHCKVIDVRLLGRAHNITSFTNVDWADACSLHRTKSRSLQVHFELKPCWIQLTEVILWLFSLWDPVWEDWGLWNHRECLNLIIRFL